MVFPFEFISSRGVLAPDTVKRGFLNRIGIPVNIFDAFRAVTQKILKRAGFFLQHTSNSHNILEHRDSTH